MECVLRRSFNDRPGNIYGYHNNARGRKKGKVMESISIKLPIQAWNSILATLGDKPFKEVADLINEIKQQAAEQLALSVPSEVSQPE